MLDTVFSAANALAMAGWLCLLAAPQARWSHGWVAGIGIPALLSVGYIVLMATHWRPGHGGFGSLTQVSQLFESRGVLLAGWVHYLAFDLLIGAWQARRATERGIGSWILSPCLVLTFLLGPLGWLLFIAADLAGRGGLDPASKGL